jgi:hypothetical protein
MEAGSAFGELALQQEGDVRSASIIATRDCSLARLRTEDWRSATDSQAGLMTIRSSASKGGDAMAALKREQDEAAQHMRMMEEEYKRVKNANDQYHVASGQLATLHEFKTVMATSVSPKHRPQPVQIPAYGTPGSRSMPSPQPLMPPPASQQPRTTSANGMTSPLEALEMLLQKLLEDEVLSQSAGHAKLIELIKQLFTMLQKEAHLETALVAQKNKAVKLSIRRMQKLTMYHFLISWKQSTEQNKQQKGILKKIAYTLMNRCVTQTFNFWADSHFERMEQKNREAVIIGRILKRMTQANLVGSFNAVSRVFVEFDEITDYASGRC